jgi:bicarbonate transport system ATP-binding protein
MQSVATTYQKNKTRSQNSFLLFEGVSKVYPTSNGPFTVLKDIDLTIDQGEFICVIGHSGCGKSTLLSMVSGFATPL